MTNDAFLAAPDGPALATVRLAGSWPWIVIALGAAIVAVGGLLLG